MPTYNLEYVTKTGDRGVDLEATLYGEDGVVINLTGMSVTFTMREVSSAVDKIDAAACSIVSAVDGTIKYEWQAADVDTAGMYYGEFIVTDAGGLETSFPRRSHGAKYVMIKIQDSL